MQPALRFGLTLDYVGGEHSVTEARNIMVALTHAARDAKFDVIYMPHHFCDTEFVRFQPLPMLARLAQEAEGMLMVWADITSLNHPVRVAHDLATLDSITSGNAALLSILGYATKEFDALGGLKKERGHRLNETYEIVSRLCMGKRVDFDGQHHQLSDVSLGRLSPVSIPRPPIWVTAHADKALERAARYGDVWFASHQPTHSELAEQIPMYKELRSRRRPEPHHAFADHGISLPILRETYVADSEKEALATAEGPMMRAVSYYIGMGQLEALRDPNSYAAPFHEWKTNRALIGDPSQVAEELKRYASIGVDCVVFKIYHEGITLEQTVRSIQLIGEQIVPEFRAS